jgi:hypothetical protein
MRAGAAAFVRISQMGQGRPQQHGWLACDSESGGLAYGSAWVGLACGSHALPSIHLDNTSIEQHAKLDCGDDNYVILLRTRYI